MSSKLIDLPGVGEKTVAVLNNHGINSVDDLLRYYPRTYRHYLAKSQTARPKDLQSAHALMLKLLTSPILPGQSQQIM